MNHHAIHHWDIFICADGDALVVGAMPLRVRLDQLVHLHFCNLTTASDFSRSAAKQVSMAVVVRTPK